MIEGTIGRIKVGDLHPVRVMAVINLSQESFYKGSVATKNQALSKARSFAKEGADLIDLGAVSTAPGSPTIDEASEKDRLLPVLRQILDDGLEVSIDTQRASIAEHALSMGATCINDVSGLMDGAMAKTVADHDASVVIMASRCVPGDLLTMNDIISVLDERVDLAIEAGIDRDKIVVDPGIGKWTPEKVPEYDLAILKDFRRLRAIGRPAMAALSRKSFIGACLNRPDPGQRLFGSLSATAVAIYNGAHIVRTHDVSSSMDTIRMAEAIRGRPFVLDEEEFFVEVLGYQGHEGDIVSTLKRMEVDPGGYDTLCKKGTFRQIAVEGISSIEAVIIKQEMLARGGDAAIPKMALRCDPNPQRTLIFGTLSQIYGLVRKLKDQPFRLPAVGKAIEYALKQIDDPGRYR